MGSARVRVGAGGWSYDRRAGDFYPEGLKPAEGLHYYASVFDTVEVEQGRSRYAYFNNDARRLTRMLGD